MTPASPNPDFVKWFRHSTPYIYAHRNTTLVLCFGGAALHDANFSRLVHDIALLHSLGMQLVLVPGARPQIDSQLERLQLPSTYHNNLRITDQATLSCVKSAIGGVRLDIEASLSLGLAHSPMAGAGIRVVSGNYVTAKPLGVVDGIDYQYTGTVRKIDAAGLKSQLESGNIVLASSLGYSLTGEIFNLNAFDVAASIAIALRADKLIFLTEGEISQHYPKITNSILPSEIATLLSEAEVASDQECQHLLRHAMEAANAGVARTHILNRQIDGVLLGELFTREGTGILVSQQPFERVRRATVDDVGHILNLITPLEQQGTLVKRSRERLEQELAYFFVVEMDHAVIACAALYPFPEEQMAELACLAVQEEHQKSGYGARLLSVIEAEARKQNLSQLFVLSTVTSHWFREKGFQPAHIDCLPKNRQALYNWQRRSKAFIKTL